MQSAGYTRFSPAMSAVANGVKRERRKERGGSMDDATRVHQLVASIVQRGMVLYYKPSEQLVLATPFSLEMARRFGRNMIVTDAKVDTTMGRSFWSSIRSGNPSQPSASRQRVPPSRTPGFPGRPLLAAGSSEPRGSA